jgi:tetratricopeptide (TPR) repeat protein
VRAATEFETAVRLDPGNVEARVQYARLLYSSGRHAEALVQLREARSVDPASALVLSHTAYAYYGMRQFDSARAEIRRAIETDSMNLTAVLFGAWVYLASNRLQEAHALTVRLPGNTEARGYLLAKSGDEDAAREMLRRLNEQPDWWGGQTQRAYTYLGLGDTANALSALERATTAGEIWPLNVQLASPTYDSIRRSARFRELLKRVGLGAYPNARP